MPDPDYLMALRVTADHACSCSCSQCEIVRREDAKAPAEGCVCGHGFYHHEGGTWPVTPINGRCCEQGCDCTEFAKKARHA